MLRERARTSGCLKVLQKNRGDRGRPDLNPEPVLPRWADLPDHAGARELDENTITGNQEFCEGVGLADVPHRAVIHHVSAAIGAEPDIRRTVEPAKAVWERLLVRGVVGKRQDLEGERLIRVLVKVDQLDLVSDF